jgi:dynamin GTPase
MLMVVTALVTFVKEDLLSAVYGDSPNEADSLLEESDESKAERREIIAVYEASRAALKIITQVDMRTKSEPLPPPVKNNIPAASSTSPTARAPPPAARARAAPSRPTPGRPAPRPAPARPAAGGRAVPSRPPTRS